MKRKGKMRRMNCKEIAQELKTVILYRAENDRAVPEIADILGLSRRTIYAYLDGEIKISIDFLHAAVVATKGDPDVKKFLEPEGWELHQRKLALPQTEDFERELGDIHIAAGVLHSDVRSALCDGEIAPVERSRILRNIDKLELQIAEVKNMVIQDGKKP